MVAVNPRDADEAYQKELDNFIQESSLKRPGSTWIAYNFPKPDHLTLSRWVRNMINWAFTVSIAYYYTTDLRWRETAVIIVCLMSACVPMATTAFMQFVLAILVTLGNLVGDCLFVMCLWLIVLYNGTPEPSSFAVACIAMAYILIVTYVASYVTVASQSIMLQVFAASTIIGIYFITQDAYTLDKMTKVGTTIFNIAAIVFATLLFGVAMLLIFPEHSVEEARMHMLKILQLTKQFLVNYKQQSPDKLRKARSLNHQIQFHVSRIDGLLKMGIMDIGWLYDKPLRMMQMSLPFARCVRHVGALMQALEGGVSTNGKDAEELAAVESIIQRVIEELDMIHDSLLTKPDWIQRMGISVYPAVVANHLDLSLWSKTDKNNFQASEAAQMAIRQSRSNWSPHNQNMSYQFFVFGLSSLWTDVAHLSEVAKSIYNARTSPQFTLPFLGWPKKPKAPRVVKPQVPLSFTGVWNSFVTAVNKHVESEGGHYATQRTISAFIIAAFAFIPATAQFFSENNGYWMLIANVVLLYPTVGETGLRTLQRLFGTIIALIFNLFAYACAPGVLSVQIAWLAPLVIVGFYFKMCVPHYPYVGTVLMLTYTIVGINPGTDVTRILLRACMNVLGALVAVSASFLLYPKFGRTMARKQLGQVLFNLRELYQRGASIPLLDPVALGAALEIKQGGDLYRATQGILVLLRQKTLYNASCEPEVDTPYNQELIEAMAASLQQLLDLLGMTYDGSLFLRAPDMLSAWETIRACWNEERMQFIRGVSLYLNSLAMCLIEKTPLPPIDMSPRTLGEPLTAMSDPKLVMERTTERGFTLSEKQAIDITYLASFTTTIHIAALAEMERLEDLMARMLGRAQWYSPEPVNQIQDIEHATPYKMA